MERKARITRKTNETQIEAELQLDGCGKFNIDTPIGFLNHMLELMTRHGLFDLLIDGKGDVDRDDHHLIEDVGIVLGKLIEKAVADKKGIYRYGFFTLPMDDVLLTCAIDLSGRMYFESNYQPVREKVNDFSTEMINHFFYSIAEHAHMNLHFYFLRPGINEHHRIEAMFKCFARALRMAIAKDERMGQEIPSTKGNL